MASMSDYLEDKFLDHMIGRATTAYPSTGENSTLFVALLNTTAIDGWTPLSTGECAGSNYSRANVANSSSNFTNSTAGSKTNKTAITFTTDASTGWGTIKAIAICDTSSTTTGNCLWVDDLTANVSVTTGDVVEATTGSLTITAA